MSCRTTSAGSAFTTYARLANGGILSDVATLSTFHELRSRYSARAEDSRRVYTDQQYRELLGRQRERTVRATNISDTRRASILARLDAALADPSTPDQATLYALHNLNPTVRDRGRNLERYRLRTAQQMGLTPAQVQEMWDAYENEIDRSARGTAPATNTPENIAWVRDELQLGTERGAVHAAVMLRQRVRQHSAEQALAQPQRIAWRNVVDPPQAFHGFTVLEHGYDRRNGRLEIVIRDANGDTSTLAYRDVPENIGAAFMDDDGLTASARWFNHVRGVAAYAYADDVEAALASPAPRCAVCGQFANNLHSCPQIGEPRMMRHYNTNSRWSRQTIQGQSYDPQGNVTTAEHRISLPAIREIREAWEAGPITLEISEHLAGYTSTGRFSWSAVRGQLTVYRDAEGSMAFNVAQLSCSCEAYRANQTCIHISNVTQAVRTRLTPAPRTPGRRATPEERAAALAEAQRIAEAEAVHDWTRTEQTLAEARRTWQANAEVSYSQDPDAFVAVYRNAVSTRPDGSSGVPFMRENVLGGMAQRGSGQAFGMEIEYEFPNTMTGSERNEAQRRIGAALHAAGLAASPNQVGYGTSKARGFRDTHTNADGSSNWSWERDGSVNGGELVTPGMYDEPETWQRLERAVEILRENGAVPTKRAGAHVHVGTSMYRGDAKKYAELARLVNQHEDVMFRLAADPSRGTHRNSHYATPLNDVPASGFSDVGAARSWQGGRTRILNYGGVNAVAVTTTTTQTGRLGRVRTRTEENTPYSSDHPEFRIFDSTLDAGAMQAQIKLAVAMTHAAARIADDAPTARGKEPVGSHARRAVGRGRRQPTDAELVEETATFRSLLDTLFTRKADKDQLTHLFAATKWSKR